MPLLYYYYLYSYLIYVIPSCLISICLAAWVYGDAKKRNMNAGLWVLIVLIIGCIGLIIYLIVREPIRPAAPPPSYPQQPPYPQQPMYPPQPPYPPQQVAAPQPPSEPPKTTVEKSTKFCGNCGGKIPSDATFCPLCGSKQ